jgi:hypothetical protein
MGAAVMAALYYIHDLPCDSLSAICRAICWVDVTKPKTNFEIKKRLTRAAHWQIKRPVLVYHQYFLSRIAAKGAIAQLGERLLCKQEVVGSIPSGSTNFRYFHYCN